MRRAPGLLGSLAVVCALTAQATAQTPQERAREDAIFGEPEEPPAEPAAPGRPDEDALFGGEEAPSLPEGEQARERDLFGQEEPPPPGLLSEAMASLDEDILTIGGMVYLRFAYTVQQDTDVEDMRLSMPNLVDLYFDARPSDRVRAFVSGRLYYDPTIDPDEPGQFGQPAPDNPDVLLDQLWLKFDLGRVMFATIGKQPVRWGPSRIWNPVDFINAARRDPLAFFDERTGVTLVKLHFPVESLGWNFYAVGLLNDADSIDKVGAAGRAEFVFETVELALSGMYQKDRKPRIGLDFSAGVGDFDIHGEAAVAFGSDVPTYEGTFDLAALTLPTRVDRDDDPVVQVSGGVNYGVRYDDEDVLYVGAEYFWNQLGYEDEQLYPYLLYERAFQPFYAGEHYAALYLLLPAPGSWNDTSFTLSTLGNLSDVSFITRFDMTVTVLQWLQVQAYASAHYGTKGGEFRFAADIPALTLPGQAPFEGLKLEPPIVDIGLNLRVSI